MAKLTAVYSGDDGKEIRIVKEVKTGWGQVTWKEYCDILANTEKEPEENILRQIEILSGFTRQELEQLGHDFVIRIGTMIGFSYDLDELQSHCVLPKQYEGFRIGKQKYGKVVIIKQRYRKLKAAGRNDFEITNMLVKEYADIEVENKPITEVIGLCTFFLINSLDSLNDTDTSAIGNTPKTRSMQGLKTWVKRMVTSLRLTTSRKVMC